MSALRMRLLLRLNMCACLLLPFIPFNKITFPTSIRNFIKKTDGTVSRVLASAVIRHNHLSETQITLRLKQPTRSYGPENPLPLGFAPNEVCTAAPVTGCAAVSYTAFSPLPVARRAVYFLLHCLSNADFASLQLPHPPGDYPAFFPAEPGLCLTGFLFHQKKSARLYPVCYYRFL